MPRKQTKTPGEHYTVEQVADALKRGGGFISYAAKILKCRHATVRDYMKKYPELAELVDEIKAADLDSTEVALQRKIKLGDNTAIIFKLKCHGKDRGFIDNPLAMHLHATADPNSETWKDFVESAYSGKPPKPHA